MHLFLEDILSCMKSGQMALVKVEGCSRIWFVFAGVDDIDRISAIIRRRTGLDALEVLEMQGLSDRREGLAITCKGR